jgi:hypothetical protein
MLSAVREITDDKETNFFLFIDQAISAISIVTDLDGSNPRVGQDDMLSVIVGKFRRVGMAPDDIAGEDEHTAFRAHDHEPAVGGSGFGLDAGER